MVIYCSINRIQNIQFWLNNSSNSVSEPYSCEFKLDFYNTCSLLLTATLNACCSAENNWNMWVSRRDKNANLPKTTLKWNDRRFLTVGDSTSDRFSLCQRVISRGVNSVKVVARIQRNSVRDQTEWLKDAFPWKQEFFQTCFCMYKTSLFLFPFELAS